MHWLNAFTEHLIICAGNSVLRRKMFHFYWRWSRVLRHDLFVLAIRSCVEKWMMCTSDKVVYWEKMNHLYGDTVLYWEIKYSHWWWHHVLRNQLLVLAMKSCTEKSIICAGDKVLYWEMNWLYLRSGFSPILCVFSPNMLPSIRGSYLALRIGQNHSLPRAAVYWCLAQVRALLAA